MPTAAASKTGTARGPKRAPAIPARSNATGSNTRRAPSSKAAARSSAGPGAKSQAKRTATSATKAGRQVAGKAAGQGRKVAGQAKEQALDVASTATDRGGALVETAKQDARALAGTVRSRAGEVTEEVAAQTSSLVEEARSQVEAQVETGTLRLAVAFQELGEEAQALAEGRPEDAPRLSGYVFDAADRCYGAADRLHALADDIQDRGLPGVLDDVQDFARRRPGAFLVGAAVVGFGIGRLVKANRAEGDGGYDASPGTGGPPSNGNGHAGRQPRALPAGGGR
ncbi:MAG TPA: hypothetical protein VM390_07720 [Acidimicrobiales bacterium]|nr:hypothetical protein [Acidimicrobiales bacterium]